MNTINIFWQKFLKVCLSKPLLIPQPSHHLFRVKSKSNPVPTTTLKALKTIHFKHNDA